MNLIPLNIQLNSVLIIELSGQKKNGTNGQVILKTRNGEFYFGHSRYNNMYTTLPLMPKATDEKVALIGIFKLCEDNKNCRVPKELFSRFSRKIATDPPTSIYTSIIGQEVNGKKIKLFFNNASLNGEENHPQLPSQIRI